MLLYWKFGRPLDQLITQGEVRRDEAWEEESSLCLHIQATAASQQFGLVKGQKLSGPCSTPRMHRVGK